MPHWNNQPWQRNLSKIASGKPGAVHLAHNGSILFGSWSLRQTRGGSARFEPGLHGIELDEPIFGGGMGCG